MLTVRDNSLCRFIKWYSYMQRGLLSSSHNEWNKCNFVHSWTCSPCLICVRKYSLMMLLLFFLLNFVALIVLFWFCQIGSALIWCDENSEGVGDWERYFFKDVEENRGNAKLPSIRNLIHISPQKGSFCRKNLGIVKFRTT